MTGFARMACMAIAVCLTAYLLYSFATGHVITDQLHVWQAGAVSLIATCLRFAHEGPMGEHQAASDCHSAKAAER